MTIGKREKILLAVLGVLIYGFIFYKFIWTRALPEIKDKNQAISAAAEQKAELDRELENLPNTKAELNTKSNSDEHLGEYLMNSANLIDGIEYIEKLSTLLGKNILEISVAKPIERLTTAQNKFYELKMAFTTTLGDDELQNLLDYIEGGTRKARVASLKMTPQGTAESKTYNTALAVSLYSINTGSIDKLYEYSRHKFSNFSEGSDAGFVPYTEDNPAAAGGPGKKVSSAVDISMSNGGLNNSSINALSSKRNVKSAGIMDSDIAIFEKAFFYPGDNLQVHGIVRPSELVGIKTKTSKNISVSFDDSSYSVSFRNDSDEARSIQGYVKSRDFIKMYVEADFLTSVRENRNLGMNIAVTNNSARKIYLTLVDGPGRVRITDRVGNIILRSNEDEKVYII